jgi:DNA helicase II / ATP-dependent DNA helicase PcrA
VHNVAILAAAGSRKTEYIVDQALAAQGRVLITTYTNENQNQIAKRIESKVGAIPSNITLLGWFTFLIAQCAKPYQRAVTGEPLEISGLNFKGQRDRFAKRTDVRYYLDKHGGMFRDGVSDFVTNINALAQGAVVRRLEKIFDHIFVDEIQDLAGYDLEVLDLLMSSTINVTMVGDPRQCTLSTNVGSKNKRYRGEGLRKWFDERADRCNLQARDSSYRCNQHICDFADSIYPALPATKSINVGTTDHDGIFYLLKDEVHDYYAKYAHVTILRNDKNADTCGLPAMNIGVSKGSTFDRVMIFPTKPMIAYLKDRDETKLKSPERLYVAVTRARFSVAFVVPERW